VSATWLPARKASATSAAPAARASQRTYSDAAKMLARRRRMPFSHRS
jgi:hypothetical protein